MNHRTLVSNRSPFLSARLRKAKEKTAHQARLDAVAGTVQRPPRSIHYPTNADGKLCTPAELFGRNVFTLKAMAAALPKPVFASFLRQMRGRQALDKVTADAVAHAVRTWAMDRGATHYAHWFQPQTDATAEKQNSFLNLRQLLQAKWDASFFPSGGMRTTFEARGYTIWDTTSPMFIQPGPGNTSILYIPSVFISYNGDALDEKTVLLRSCETLSKAACGLLNLLDPVPQGVSPRVHRVFTTLGTEQEYFLVDRNLYALRPDLKVCGGTLLGSAPAKHQQMEDHYFGRIPTRVLSAMSEAELELWKLGVPVKTRHNGVAPAQFEIAPIFEEVGAMIAVDHNLLTVDVLHRAAHRHKLKALFHEKPFK
ncbi:MAG: glutamine synthetase, partial [Olpidium bornovanus]